MILSNGEKLILMMLADIYEKVDVDGEFDPEFIRSAIINNQTWGISWRYPGIPFDKVEEPEVVREVLNILDMWSFIEYAYKQFTAAEKKILLEELDKNEESFRFNGFDYNNDHMHVSAMSFIVNDLGRYQEFQGRYLNSHSSISLGKYRCMLHDFEQMRNNSAMIDFRLSTEDFLILFGVEKDI